MSPLAAYFARNPTLRKSHVARELGITPGRVTQLCDGGKPSPELANLIEEHTGIPRWQLRPDIFPVAKERVL